MKPAIAIDFQGKSYLEVDESVQEIVIMRGQETFQFTMPEPMNNSPRECCEKCEGTQYDGIDACLNTTCSCHSNSTQKENWESRFDAAPTFEKTAYGVLGAHVERYVLIDKDFIRETIASERAKWDHNAPGAVSSFHTKEQIEKIREKEREQVLDEVSSWFGREQEDYDETSYYWVIQKIEAARTNTTDS